MLVEEGKVVSLEVVRAPEPKTAPNTECRACGRRTALVRGGVGASDAQLHRQARGLRVDHVARRDERRHTVGRLPSRWQVPAEAEEEHERDHQLWQCELPAEGVEA